MLWSHLPNGSKTQTFPFLRQTSLPVLLMLATLFFTAPVANGAEPLSRQQLTVGFDLDEGRIFGTSQITLAAGHEAHLELGDLTITYLRLDGEKLVATQTDDHRIILPASNQQRVLTVSFEKIVPTDPREATDNLIGKKGITLTGFWHPALDTPCSFELVADLPASFTAISEADRIESQKIESGQRFTFHLAQPTTSIHLIAGEYVVEETSFGKGKKLVTYFFKEDQQLAAHYRDKAKGYLDRYRKLIGDFPYQRFSVVENRLPTGYAMPTFTLLGQAVVRLPFITETSLGHEVLHQWFGNAVAVDYAKGNWAEGLATYLADHAYAEDEGKGIEFRRAQLIKYQSYVPEKNDLSLNHFMGGTSHLNASQQQNRAVGYAKGMMVFHMLRQQLGDEDFHKGIRDFYQRMRFREASWDDLRTSFETAGRQELKPFFDQWLNRADIPEITVKNLTLDEKEGHPELSFTLVQQNETPYQMTVPMLVQVGTEQKSSPVKISEKETKVSLPFAAPPTQLIIDGDHDLMRALSPEELPPVWSRFDGAANKLAVVADDEAAARFAPLLEWLEQQKCEVKTSEEATDKDVAAASVIFLGASPLSRSLFATPTHPDTGFTVDVRRNPLNNNEVAVLMTADSPEQVRAGLRKLRHYGKYNSLHFDNGRAVNKQQPETKNGLIFSLDQPPQGVVVAKTRTFAEIVEQLLANRVVYVGEGHTTYEDHLLQLRIIRALFQHDQKLAIGMEMFNRSAQSALDDYLAGKIDEAEMLRRTEYFKRWGYDYRHYRDIIRFAHANKIPLIALNQQKEIVSKVFRESGTASLSKEEQELLPEDRDLDIPGYRERIHSVFTMHSHPSPEQFKGFIQAQALWDETMAATVADYLTTHPDQRVVVIAGVGHVAKAEAIPVRVARRINIKQAVVANINSTEADPEQLDYAFLLTPAELPPAPIMGVMIEDKDGMVIVEQLSPHGKAKEMGIIKNDVIIALDGQPIKSVADLKIIMLGKNKGDSVQVKIKRARTLFPDEILEIAIPL
ncbi:MAG: ChaN family lipoprotein [Desulfobulbaceae bacterium]|nr:ChaN family lipoprotein [Desulfobulbaceae bacterium]